jgi:ABC-type multidrug transport system fused ATPase/permease subunit
MLSFTSTSMAPGISLHRIFQRFWPYAHPHRKMLALSFAFVAASPAVDAASVWIYKRLVDEVVVPHDLAPLPPLALAYLALTLLSGGISFGDRSLSAWVGQRFLLLLRTSFFRHLQACHWSSSRNAASEIFWHASPATSRQSKASCCLASSTPWRTRCASCSSSPPWCSSTGDYPWL